MNRGLKLFTSKASKSNMGQLMNAIMSFIRQAITVRVMGSFLLLIAREFRSAALKKASQGSSKLSAFTEKMTKTKLKLSH